MRVRAAQSDVDFQCGACAVRVVINRRVLPPLAVASADIDTSTPEFDDSRVCGVVAPQLIGKEPI
eukprot:11215406-Lingulodinium_polyedra.AAC.1